MKKYFLVLILVFAVALTASGTKQASLKSVSAAMSNCDEHSRGLCVTATGTVKAKPDFAALSFSVETKNVILEDAQSENAKQIQDMLTSLKEQGIDETDIKTIGFFIYPEYDYTFGQELTGYRIINQINVKVKDLDNIGKVIDITTHSGANTVNGIQFLLEDNTSSYNHALEKACELAKEKAFILSQAAGIDDIKIISIKEIPNNFYGIYERAYFAKPLNSGSMVQTQIMQGDIEISATVELRYELL